jgi:hypothetical protein
MHNRIQPLIAPLCKECSILIFVGVTLIMNGMMFTHWALPDVTHMPSRRALPEATLKPDRAWKRHFIDRTRPIPSRVRTALYSLHSWLCIGTSDWARGVALLLEWVSIPDCWAWLTSASELAIACLEEEAGVGTEAAYGASRNGASTLRFLSIPKKIGNTLWNWKWRIGDCTASGVVEWASILFAQEDGWDRGSFLFSVNRKGSCAQWLE